MPTTQGNLQSLVNVNYTPPNQNFNKSLVKGRLVRIIQVKDERYSTALEEAAGSQLFSIVIENDVTASMMIKNNCFLKQYVTLIPNNTV
jgi:structural maintenance of chromosome 2